MSFLRLNWGNSFWAVLCLALNLFSHLFTGAFSISYNCSKGSAQASINFSRDLQNRLYSLADKASSEGFFNDSFEAGESSIYGLALCRADIASTACSRCLRSASSFISALCPSSQHGMIWLPSCMLHYEGYNFFGLADSSNPVSESSPDEDDASLPIYSHIPSLIENTTKLPLLFSIVPLENPNATTKYVVAQCTRDLSSRSCNECLEKLTEEQELCCRGRIWWHIFARSCYISYDLEAYFYRSPGAVHPSQVRNRRNVSGWKTPGITPLPPSVPAGQNSAPNYDEKKAMFNEKKVNFKTLIIVVAGILGALVGIAVLGSCVWRKQKKQGEGKETSQEALLKALGHFRNQNASDKTRALEDQITGGDLPFIDLATLQVATQKFSDSNKLGEGGYGPVYKGTLPDGNEVAVKRLSRSSGQGLIEFRNEVTLIAKLQHRNLVRLLYCCLERGENMLVYEFMANTSLDVFLFDPIKRVELDWQRRISIVKGIARGLLYLHEDSRLKIIHRDLKASNVLLDLQMNPKISDFGMARIFGGTQNHANTNRVVGTYGYMAPEYAMEGLFSVKSDVYSFGVLLLEILSGKRNTGFYRSDIGLSLLDYAWRLWFEGKGLELVDPLIQEQYSSREALRCLHIGLLCVQQDAEDRPTMSAVLLMLGSASLELPQPTQPAFSVRKAGTAAGRPPSNVNPCSINEITVSRVEPR